ncbi:MAG: prolyl oligopeptidase family serine peptidase, partial [Candidatus Latescibacteria bacterium]|nr:prolyl oligopeptidase family serine peptidase [Candidatus Latescibacterota bacterium]
MTYSHALILGTVQGLTEFLPVSSSGHLVLAQQFFALSENMMNFDIFVHFGTLLSVLVVFRTTILRLISGCALSLQSCIKGKTSLVECYRLSKDLQFLTALIVGTVPAVLVGFTMKDAIEGLFSSVVLVLAALFFTGIVLVSTFFVKRGERSIGPAKGFAVGIAQALAIIPGISRSGSTISTALFFKVKRTEAAEFSFLLSIPVIAGATLLALIDTAGSGFSSIAQGPYVIGALSAFVTGWISLVVLMKIVKRGKIGYFGFYCLAVVFAGAIFYGSGCFPPQPGARSERENTVQRNVISITSSYDGTQQKVRYFRAKGKKRPLLVALHTWSFDYTQESFTEYSSRCKELDWHLIFPDFRGVNNKPEACCSQAALNDIVDAVNWAAGEFDVDHRRIFLAGASGGGMMALRAAAFSPSTWTAVSSWVPISDLARWHRESVERELQYFDEIERCCGGPPGASSVIDEEYTQRSPIHSLWRAHIIPVDINAGIHDGHGGILGGEGSV